MMKARLFALFLGLFFNLLMVGCEKGSSLEELQMNGKHTEYYDDGQKKEEGFYKDSKKDGFSTIWYENGQKRIEGNYKDGKPDGLWIKYREDGTEVFRQTFKNGELVD